MIDTLYDIRDFIQANLMLVLAGGMIVILLVGFMMFTISVIIPQLQARNELAAQVVSAQESLAQSQSNQAAVPDSLSTQIAGDQARLETIADVFMSEARAADTLNNLYRYADQGGVDVVDLQAQSGPETAVKNVYDARVFRIQVEGAVPNLLAYVTQIAEASLPSFAIDHPNGAKALAGIQASTGSPPQFRHNHLRRPAR